jgi:hypothetical protein
MTHSQMALTVQLLHRTEIFIATWILDENPRFTGQHSQLKGEWVLEPFSSALLFWIVFWLEISILIEWMGT